MKSTALILLGLLWACLGMAVRGSPEIALSFYDGVTIAVTVIASVVLFVYALDLDPK